LTGTRHTEADSTALSSGTLIGLPTPVEHKRQEVGHDGSSNILYINRAHISVDTARDATLALGRCEGDRIGHGCVLNRVKEWFWCHGS